MKWGVRRFQNEDGSLTPAGEKRYEKVASSKRLQKVNTRRAKKVYKSNLKMYSDLSESNYNYGSRMQKKASKYMDKSISAKNKGNVLKSEKYQNKAEDALTASIKAKRTSGAFKYLAESTSRKIKDIDDGTLKAGRDFITHTSYSGLLVPGGIMVGSKTTVIERKKQKIDKIIK